MARSKWIILSREAKAADREAAVSGYIVGLLFPALIGVGGAYTTDLARIHSLLPFVFWAILLVFYAVFWWRVRPSSRSLIGLLREEERISAELRSRQIDVEQLSQSVDLLVWQSEISLSTRRMVVAYVSQGLTTLPALQEALGEILAPIYERSEDLFGTGGSEKWSFAVYLYSKRDDELVPVWNARSSFHPSTGGSRTWGRGEGHVGKAFVNASAIVTLDALHPDVAALSATPDSKTRTYDAIYRSFAAIPIGPISDESLPFGVLVGTSDRRARYDQENTNVLRHLADVIASLMALAHIDVDAIRE